MSSKEVLGELGCELKVFLSHEDYEELIKGDGWSFSMRGKRLTSSSRSLELSGSS